MDPSPTEIAACLPDGHGSWRHMRAAAATAVAAVPGDVGRVLDALPGRGGDGAWWIVYVSFEGGLALLGAPAAHAAAGPLALAARAEAVAPCAPPPPAPPAQWRPEWDEVAYGAAFAELQAAILAGEIYQSNLTFRLHGEPRHGAAPPAADPAPPAWAAHLRAPGLELWSRSPECFLVLDPASGTATTSPIKGTIAAGGDAAALGADPKERAEHVMIVDMARNDLGRVSAPGGVAVNELCVPLALPYATHLVSHVRGRLRPDADLAAVLRATLPAASISGTPKHRACQWIGRLEASPRGPYTGVLGWVDPNGRAALSVLIRTAWRTPAGLRYGTGGGIVADSDPQREYAEALLKAAPVQAHAHGT